MRSGQPFKSVIVACTLTEVVAFPVSVILFPSFTVTADTVEVTFGTVTALEKSTAETLRNVEIAPSISIAAKTVRLRKSKPVRQWSMQIHYTHILTAKKDGY